VATPEKKKGAVALFAKKILGNPQKRAAFASASDADKDAMIDAALGPRAADLPSRARVMFKGLSLEELNGLDKMQTAMAAEPDLVESVNTNEGPATLAKL